MLLQNIIQILRGDIATSSDYYQEIGLFRHLYRSPLHTQGGSMRKKIIVTFIILLALTTGLLGCGRDQKKTNNKAAQPDKSVQNQDTESSDSDSKSTNKKTKKPKKARRKGEKFPPVAIDTYKSRGKNKRARRRGSNLETSRIDNILRLARRLIGKKHRSFHYKRFTFTGDCSGFVRFLFATQRVKLIEPAIKLKRKHGAYAIYYSMKYNGGTHKRKKPRPGDLVFFDNTYDINKDKKVNDPFTHVGIVEKVMKNGTIYFIHYINPKLGVVRDKLNLKKPNSKKRNSYIRDRRKYPHPKKKYLTGQLFAGFATVRMD